MNIRLMCYVMILVLLSAGVASRAVELQQGEKNILPDKVSSPVKIDGDLNENIWAQPPIEKEFISYAPNYGDPLGQDTKIWAAYDGRNLYFAFKCSDTEPHKIKTSISQRDKILNDDFVGILLDSTGSKQSGYEFYVNPNGIQLDALNSAVSGLDFAPDFVWESAGKVTDQGYQVEIRIPLESIRFKSGKQVKMGIIFIRQISRTGMMGSWPQKEAGQTEFNFMTTAVYQGLKQALKLEILPNFTTSRDWDRKNPETWDKSGETDFGAAIKYGITSAVTLEGTVSPDFSHVESDVFQMEFNRRYPVFYSEKRPFFMEGMDVFDFGIIREGMMLSAIHTRRIIDPAWAAKLSGSAGKMNFALLTAKDRFPGWTWETGTNPYQDRQALFGVLRLKYNVGSDNSLGILYSGRYFEEQENNVGGFDIKYRFLKNLRTTFSYLHSATKEAPGLPVKNGNGWNAMMEYYTPHFTAIGAYERYDRDFYMATAFQNRVNISRGWFVVGPRFNMKIKKLPWLQRIQPYFRYSKLHDLGTKMDDITRTAALNLVFTRQGFLSFQYWHEDESWAGQQFEKKYFTTYGQIQLFKWLYFTAHYTSGNQLYYDPQEPFVGKERTRGFGIVLQPGIKWNSSFDYFHTAFYEKTNNLKIYSVDIFNLHTTYQFNKYFFIRGIIRYDNLQEKLLTDFLASFTLIPGTVVHLGYGSLYERKEWRNNQWIVGQGDLLKIKQGLFFKASYLIRIK